MNRQIIMAVMLSAAVILPLYTVSVKSAVIRQDNPNQSEGRKQANVLREYKGVHLDMSREEVKKAMGDPSMSTDNTDDFKLTGEDLMTVHYDNGSVKAIQLAFFDTKNAPPWKSVVGDAEVNVTESGARHARRVVADENFWVSIWQNKDSSMTRITISH